MTANVVANDRDPDDDSFAITAIAQPANGTAAFDAQAGTITYTPDADFSGTDTVTYTLTDARGATSVGTLTVTVSATPDAPVARDDTGQTPIDTAVTLPVLANDTDADGDTLTIGAITDVTGGTATANADGTVTFIPAAGFVGDAGFTYSVSDGTGRTDTADVTVSVSDTPPEPEILTLVLRDAAGEQVAVLSPKAQIDPALFTSGEYSLLALPGTGDIESVQFQINGQTVRTENVEPYAIFGDFGTRAVEDDTNLLVTATAFANNNGSGAILGSVTVPFTFASGAANMPPVATNDTVATPEDTTVTVDVLANDSDPDNDPLSVLSVSDPASGSTTLNANGTITYTPDAGFVGIDTFTYAVSDGDLTDTATVTVAVSEPNPTQPAVTFQLIHADTDQVIDANLTNGEVIAATLAEGKPVSVAVLVDAAAAGGAPGSVRFSVNGEVVRTESVAPYALFGDVAGDFAGEVLASGTPFAVTAEVFAGPGASGTKLVSRSINLWDY